MQKVSNCLWGVGIDMHIFFNSNIHTMHILHVKQFYFLFIFVICLPLKARYTRIILEISTFCLYTDYISLSNYWSQFGLKVLKFHLRLIKR